jgi:hypothetical protein
LEDTWQKFQKKLCPSHKLKQQNEKPSVAVVLKSVQEAQASWQKHREQTKAGKAKMVFEWVAQSLNNHNYLFDLMPKGDKYTSILVGAFSAVVKVRASLHNSSLHIGSRPFLYTILIGSQATVTHQQIASDISDGLDDISNQVHYFSGAIKRHPRSDYIKRHIALFYCVFFKFLISLMRHWYQSSWNRLLKSFGSGFLEKEVRSTMQKLQKYTTRIREEDVSAGLAGIGKYMQDCLVDQFKSLKSELKAEIRKAIWSPAMYPALLDSPVISEPRSLLLEDTDPIDDRSWTTNTILHDTQKLETCLQPTFLAKLTDQARSLSVNQDVFHRLHKWATTNSSDAVWISGPYGASAPSQNTLTAAFMVASLQRLQIPVISYFCHYETAHDKSFDRGDELARCVYTLIFQAAQMLPEELSSRHIDQDIDLSSARFEQLDGSPGTLREALELLRNLMLVGPLLYFCLVDGLQLLESQDRNTELGEYLDELVDILCKAPKGITDKKRLVKIGFTTSGHSRILKRMVKLDLLDFLDFDEEEGDEPLRLREVDIANITR